MSISAAGAAAGLTHEALPARLGVTGYDATTGRHIIQVNTFPGLALFVTSIDVFSDGSAEGDFTIRVVAGGSPHVVWNDTFGSATEGTRHWRGLVAVMLDQAMDIDSGGPSGTAAAYGFVVPYNAGAVWATP